MVFSTSEKISGIFFAWLRRPEAPFAAFKPDVTAAIAPAGLLMSAFWRPWKPPNACAADDKLPIEPSCPAAKLPRLPPGPRAPKAPPKAEAAKEGSPKADKSAKSLEEPIPSVSNPLADPVLTSPESPLSVTLVGTGGLKTCWNWFCELSLSKKGLANVLISLATLEAVPNTLLTLSRSISSMRVCALLLKASTLLGSEKFTSSRRSPNKSWIAIWDVEDVVTERSSFLRFTPRPSIARDWEPPPTSMVASGRASIVTGLAETDRLPPLSASSILVATSTVFFLLRVNLRLQG